MSLSFSVFMLIAAGTVLLLFGVSNFSFWLIQRHDRTLLWMAAWLGAGVVFSVCRLLQYASLSEQLYIWIPRLLLTASFSLAWWGYGLGNSFTGYRPKAWERPLIFLLTIAPILVLWTSDLILTKQVVIRTIAWGGEFSGVQTDILYLPASILILTLGAIPPVRLLQARNKQNRENQLLAMGFVFVILFSLADFLTTSLNLTWPRLSDYSYLPTSFILGFIQAQRFSRLYRDMDRMVHERTAKLSQANETLCESEARYRLLFNNTPVGILLVNPKGQILQVNSSALRILGSPSAEATLGINMFSFQPLIEAGISASLVQCFGHGKSIEGEYIYTSKWGKTVEARVCYVPILDDAGATTLVQLIIEDTTEKMRAEKVQACVYEIAQAAVTIPSLDQLYVKIHETLQQLLPTQYFYIALYDEKNNLLSFPYFQDAFDTAPPPAKPGRGLTEYVLRTCEPLLASQEICDELTANGEIELVGPESLVWLGVPLIAHDQAIGVMVVQSYKENVHFSLEDLEMMTYVSTQIASAIERKQAEENLRSRVDELSALYQTTLDIISKHDLPDLLTTIVRRAVDLLDGSSGGMYLCDSKLEQARCVVSYKTPEDYTGTVLAYGEGAAGFVASTGQPLIIDNYRTWKGRAAAYEDIQPFSAVISAPMLWQGQANGVLHVLRDKEQHKFTVEDLKLLTSFANQAAIAVENTRLFSEIQQHVGELEATAKVAAALRVTETIQEMLPILLREAAEAVGAGASTIFMLEPESGDYLCEGSYPSHPDLTGLRNPPGEGMVGYVAAAGEIYMTRNIHLDPRAKLLPGETDVLAGLRGMISLPLHVQDEIIAVMQFGLHQERLFSDEEVHLLTSIADMAANAIRRARLFEEANRRLKRLASLHRIDQVITGNLDLRLTLNTLLGQLMQQLEVDAAAVLVYQPELQNLEYAAGDGFRSMVPQSTSLRLGQGYAGRAALERRIMQVVDLSQGETGFLRSPEFRREGFVAYIGVPLIAKGNITGVLEIYHRKPLDFNPEWMAFLETLASQAAIAIYNLSLFEKLQSSNLQLSQAYDATIEGWAQALELRDMETKGHSYRAVELTLELAPRLGMSTEELAHIRRGVLLHDIGKMGVPDAILQKPGPLTGAEWDFMRQHPVFALQMLSSIPYLKPALDIPCYHHEKWDGSGYPHGLKAEAIPLAARIFAVVDVYDALTSDRPYRAAWSKEKALAYIRDQSGKHFDPQVVDAFLQLIL